MTVLQPYLRVSRTNGRNTDVETSAAEGRRLITAAAKGKFKLADWLEDFDESGGKLERPGVQEALRRVEAGEVDGIIVASIDRFSRSVQHGLLMIERIHNAGGQFVSLKEGFDTSTAIGRMCMTFVLSIAQLYREQAGEQWFTQKQQAVEDGVYISKLVPFGYRRSKRNRSVENSGVLEVDSKAAAIVQRVFEERERGMSWVALVVLLNKIAPKKDGVWTAPTVRYMVKNRAYLGESRHGDLVNPHAHEPIIERKLFESVQQTKSRVNRKHGSLLAGTLICSGCGRPMTHGPNGGRMFYQCQRVQSSGRCPKPVQIRAEQTDVEVEKLFLAWAHSRVITKTSARDDQVDEATARLEAAERELADYQAMNLISVIGKDAFVEQVRLRAAAVDEARAALRDRTVNDVPLHGFNLIEDWEQIPKDVKRELIAAEMKITVLRASSPGSRAPVGERLDVVWLHERDDQVGVLAP